MKSEDIRINLLIRPKRTSKKAAEYSKKTWVQFTVPVTVKDQIAQDAARRGICTTDWFKDIALKELERVAVVAEQQEQIAARDNTNVRIHISPKQFVRVEEACYTYNISMSDFFSLGADVLLDLLEQGWWNEEFVPRRNIQESENDKES